jgi:DNA-binding transcriptional LysR family regulator
MISSSDLSYFIEITRCKTLSQASVSLGISQPSLSLALRRIENVVGEKLVIRNQKGLSLTPAGRKLLEHSKTILQYWYDVKEQMSDAHHSIQGTLTVGCHVDLAQRFIPKIFSKLLNANPKLSLNFEHDLSRNITNAVINLEIDIAIVVNPLDHPSLVIEKIESDTVQFVATKKYINQFMSKTNCTLICDQNLLQTKYLLSHIKKTQLKFTRIINTKSLELITKLAMEDAGIAIVPQSIHQYLSKGSLIVAPNTPVYTDEICLVYHYENRNVASISAIAKAIREY